MLPLNENALLLCFFVIISANAFLKTFASFSTVAPASLPCAHNTILKYLLNSYIYYLFLRENAVFGAFEAIPK